MAGRIAYLGNISAQGLVLNLDAAIQGSYPKTGSLWTDISGNNNNGTLTNGPAYTGSDYGAIVFDGTNDFVTGSVINTPNQLSVFCFKNPKPRTGTIYPVYAAKWSAEPPSIDNRSWLVGIQPGGVDYIAISSDGTYTNSTIKRFEFSSSVSNNIWTQVGFTFNNGTLVPYLNGAPASYTASLNANITSIYTSSISYTLGYLKDGVLDTYLSGSIATAQIYNQALSQFQVWQNFNAYKSRYGIPDIVTNGLILNLDAGNPYSYLSGSSGTTWTNVAPASSSLSGTLINGPVYRNGAIAFDGTNDYVSIPAHPISYGYTLSFWAYVPDTLSGLGSLIGDGNQSNTVGYIWIYRSSTNGLQWQFATDTVRNLINVTTIFSGSLNSWANYVFVSNYTNYPSGSLTVYKNGVLLTTATFPNIQAPLSRTRFIGGYDGASNNLSGSISSYLEYDKALTQTEITQNFNALRGRYGI